MEQAFIDLNLSSDLQRMVKHLSNRIGDDPQHRLLIDELKSAIVIAPSARTSFKTWPKEKFIELCGMIARAFPVRKVILVGDRAEERVATAIQCHFPYTVISLTGVITLREYAALVGNAALLIAHDSAAMHIGNYERTPLIALFGPTSALQYGEHSDTSTVIKRTDLPCIPCRGVRCDINRACLTGLTADEVFAEVMRKLPA